MTKLVQENSSVWDFELEDGTWLMQVFKSQWVDCDGKISAAYLMGVDGQWFDKCGNKITTGEIYFKPNAKEPVEDKPEEMTVAQVSKELGREIKIVRG